MPDLHSQADDHDGSTSARAERPPRRRRRAALVAGALVIVALAGSALHWLRQETIYTDGDRIQQGARLAHLREILWEPPTSVGVPAQLDDETYEPRLSADGLTLYFVRGKAGSNADIFVSTLTAVGDWTPPAPLEAINSPDDELGPTPSADGQSLFFYSDRPGGLGGYDLWVSHRGQSEWQPPLNLGPAVNSAYNEYGPALTVDGSTLYFASNRPPTTQTADPPPDTWPATIREDLFRRTYDLYVAPLGPRGPGNAQAVLALNTPHNEGAAAVTPFGDFLYFASDRPDGHGGYDLYRVRRLRGEFLAPENLGSAVNTAANELDPSMTLGGFTLYFSSDRPVPSASTDVRPTYALYRTTSREVLAERVSRPFDVGWAAIWRAIGPNLLWALLALLLLLGLLALMSDVKGRRMSLLTRCLLASLAAHLLLMLLLNVWEVGIGLAEGLRNPRRVKVSLASAQAGDLAGQFRTEITFANPEPPVATDAIRTFEPATPVAPAPLMETSTIAPSPRIEPEPLSPTKLPDSSPARTGELPEIQLHRVLTAIARQPDIPPPTESRPTSDAEPASHPPRPAQDEAWNTARSRPPTTTIVRADPVELDPRPMDAQTAAPSEMELPAAFLAPSPDVEPQREAVDASASAALDSIPPPAQRDSLGGGGPADERCSGTRHPPRSGPPSPLPIAVRLDDPPNRYAASAAEPSTSPPRVVSPWPVDSDDPATPRFAGPPPAQEAFALVVNTEPTDSVPSNGTIQRPEWMDFVPPPSSDASPRHAPTIDATTAASVLRREPLGVAVPRLEEPPAQDSEPIADPLPVVVLEPFGRTAPTSSTDATSPSLPTLNLSSQSLDAGPVIVESIPLHRDSPHDGDTDRSADRPGLLPTRASLPGSRPLSIPVPDDLAPPVEHVPVAQEHYAQRSSQERLERIRAHGGSDATENAVRTALQWLADHQSPDGHWDGEKFDDRCGGCGGQTEVQVHVALTGLSLLAFLAADHTHLKDGPHREHVERALRWLTSQQRSNGDLRGQETLYSQGIATIALAEAYGMTGDSALREPVRRAVEFIERARNRHEGGWRYDPGQAGDTSVLGWQVMAFKSAALAGVDVSGRSFQAARAWMDQVASPTESGRYAYQPGRNFTPAMTAEGMFIQQTLGVPAEDSRMQASAAFLAARLPDWQDAPNTYYWYYATLALFQHQGAAWETWNQALTRELLAHQRSDLPAAGSWDPTGEWAAIGGRVYQTALCTLMLEVYYRYLPLYSQPVPADVIGSITGHVTDAHTGQPLAGATVRLDLPDGLPATAVTAADGRYVLFAPEVPAYFALSASRPSYLPRTVNVAAAQVRERVTVMDFALQPADAWTVPLEQVPDVHHLGNDQFVGRINSQFQKAAEGDVFSATFTLAPDQLASLPASSSLRLLAKGVQCDHRVSINGRTLDRRLDESPEDGSFGLFSASFDPSYLQAGQNTFSIQAVSCRGDVDDFEFVNVQIHLVPAQAPAFPRNGTSAASTGR